VLPSLQKHASGWPSEADLLSKIAGGQIGFGMEGVGKDRSTAGSELIIQAIDKDDPRPVWVAINAGSNTLAQALWDVRDQQSPEDVPKFVAKIRVYDDSGQDNAEAWMAHEFPDLFYIRSRSQIFGIFGPGFMTGPQPWAPMSQSAWIETSARTRHGILGALYPQRLWVIPPWNDHHTPTTTRNVSPVACLWKGAALALGLAWSTKASLSQESSPGGMGRKAIVGQSAGPGRTKGRASAGEGL
jgi:hypothetical protein